MAPRRSEGRVGSGMVCLGGGCRVPRRGRSSLLFRLRECQHMVSIVRWGCCRLTNASEKKRNAVPGSVWYYVAQMHDTADGEYCHEDVAGDVAWVVWVEVEIRFAVFAWEDRMIVVHGCVVLRCEVEWLIRRLERFRAFKRPQSFV